MHAAVRQGLDAAADPVHVLAIGLRGTSVMGIDVQRTTVGRELAAPSRGVTTVGPSTVELGIAERQVMEPGPGQR